MARVSQDGWHFVAASLPLPLDELEKVSSEPIPTPPPPTRRSSRKGQATGWIEERLGNTRRKHSNLSLYYCWYETIAGERKKQRLYIPVNQCQQITAMVHDRQPWYEIVPAIQKRTDYHTYIPKL